MVHFHKLNFKFINSNKNSSNNYSIPIPTRMSSVDINVTNSPTSKLTKRGKRLIWGLWTASRIQDNKYCKRRIFWPFSGRRRPTMFRWLLWCFLLDFSQASAMLEIPICVLSSIHSKVTSTVPLLRVPSSSSRILTDERMRRGLKPLMQLSRWL